MILYQILQRLEKLHEIGFIHNDIHPEHFLIGKGDFQDTIYILSLRKAIKKHTYENKEGSQIEDKVFQTLNQLQDLPIGPKDDLEGVYLMAIYFLKGSLPWFTSHSMYETSKIPNEELM